MRTRDGGKNRFTNAIAQACGVIAAGFGFFALLGWVLQLPLLAGLWVAWMPIAPMPALLFALYGTAVFIRARAPGSRSAYWMGMAVVSVGAPIALLVLLLSLLGICMDAEHFGVTMAGTAAETAMGHMFSVTALCFVLAGLSFLASLSSSSFRPWRAVAASVFAWLVLFVSLVLLTAYFLGSLLLYGGHLVSPAFATGLAFVALGIALLVFTEMQGLHYSGRIEMETKDIKYALALIFCILALSIVTVGSLYWRKYESRYREGVERQLSVVAELKVGVLAQYRKERLGNAAVFYRNASFSSLVRRALEKPEGTEAREQLRTWLGQEQENLRYDRVFLLDSRGVERMSVPDAPAPVASIISRRASEIVRAGAVLFQDFYRDEYDQRIYLAVIIPVLGGQDDNRSPGILVLRVDPAIFIYPFLKKWPTPSRTAETLLVRRDGNDVLCLNELRFQKNTALTLRIPLGDKDVPAVKAALGEEGIVEGRDYRGVAVTACVRAIPGSPWFLVTRMDNSEVHAPLREKLWMLAMLVSTLLIGAGAGVGSIWRQQNVRYYLERRKMERRILHVQRLESIGVLAGGIAHDFNNLLAAILGNLELARIKLPHGSRVKPNIEDAIHAACHAADLTRQVLAYAGKGQFVINDLNLSDLMGENAYMLRASISKNVSLDIQLGRNLPPISADMGQVQQVVMNLITNASEALGERAGIIALSTSTMECEKAYLGCSRLAEKPAPGRFVFLEVIDTGCGMDAKTRERIFDAFFTTKAKGRGLGMSAVLGIVRAHKGAIIVQSEPGKGTAVRVLFPVSEAAHAAEGSPAGAWAVRRHAAEASVFSGTILVVDDEEAIRELYGAVLPRLGFRTLVASDGEEAVALFRDHVKEIACILLDLTMPRLDGVATLEALRRIKSDVKIIFSSGYDEKEAHRRFECRGPDGFIMKPFCQEALMTELQRVLEKTNTRECKMVAS